MRKLFAVLTVALLASYSGHHAFAMDLSKEPRSPRVEDQRGDYVLYEQALILVQGEVWVRWVYVPAAHNPDQMLQICVVPLKKAGMLFKATCMSIIQQTEVEKGVY